jgi:hypothetical protein
VLSFWKLQENFSKTSCWSVQCLVFFWQVGLIESYTHYLLVEHFIWQYWDLNSGLHACEVGSVPLEPYLWPFFSGHFGDRVPLFAQADLNCSLPTLASHCSGMTGMHHHTQPVSVEM